MKICERCPHGFAQHHNENHSACTKCTCTKFYMNAAAFRFFDWCNRGLVFQLKKREEEVANLRFQLDKMLLSKQQQEFSHSINLAEEIPLPDPPNPDIGVFLR